MTWPQLLTLPLTVLLVGWLARRARRPGPVMDGWHTVRYSLVYRWLSVAGCGAMLTCGVVLIPSILEGRPASTGTLVFAVLGILVVVLLSAYVMLFTWRNWVKYNGETLINSTTWSDHRRLAWQNSASLAWLAHEAVNSQPPPATRRTSIPTSKVGLS
jgi:hypothetical protein